MKDTRPKNAIYIIKMITEKAIQIQWCFNSYFIDYAVTFDMVLKKYLFETVRKEIFGTGVRLIQNLFWEIPASYEFSRYRKTEWGVRQVCIILSVSDQAILS